ncbi:MAG TPA: hypothetical protein VFX03_03330, partial [Thermomicrobiales bacterium]|nr:hypothetical protein [Thermomicrobiales bacterium]
YAQIPLGGSAAAAGSIYIQETADAQLALTKSQADADLAWVISKAAADSGFLTSDATSWDGMVHTESTAVDTFAHTDDAAAQAEGDAIGADEAGTMVPQAQADETQQSGDATADDDFMEAEDNQTATEWQALANQLGTPWAQEQAAEASAEASWASTAASNYESYVSKLGAAETAYATSDASQFTDEVNKIDLADQTDGDAAADADQTLANTLADDETAVEQAAAGADNAYWVATAQANHDFRVAAAQALHDVLTGGSFAAYNAAMTAAANNQTLALNAAIGQFRATVDPVVARMVKILGRWRKWPESRFFG